MKILRQRVAGFASLVAVFGVLCLLLAPAATTAGGGSEPHANAAGLMGGHFCATTDKEGSPAKDGRHAKCCIFCGSSGRFDDAGPHLFLLTRYDAALDPGAAVPAHWRAPDAPAPQSRKRGAWSSRAPPPLS